MSRFDDCSADDLRLFKEVHEDGIFHYLVYSFEIDALSLVGEEEIAQLRRMGVQEIDELPD